MKKYFGILLVGLSFGICGVSSADVYQCKGGFSGDKKPVEVFPDEFEINMCVDSLIHRNGTIFQYLGTKEPFRALRIFAKGGMEDNPKALVEWSNRKRYYKCQWIQKPCSETVPEVTASSLLKTQMAGRSDNQVCVHSNNGQPKYIEEAKRRGLGCGVNKTSTSDVETTLPVPETNSTNSTKPKVSKLDKAKSTCRDIGFTAGTEKFGECVLKLIDQNEYD